MTCGIKVQKILTLTVVILAMLHSCEIDRDSLNVRHKSIHNINTVIKSAFYYCTNIRIPRVGKIVPRSTRILKMNAFKVIF